MPWWGWALSAWLVASAALALLVSGSVRLRELRDPRTRRREAGRDHIDRGDDVPDRDVG